MSDPTIAALAREARRDRLLPRDARCETCRTTRYLADDAGRVLCYACRRGEAGARPTELDHVAGRRNLGGLIVELRQNDHRAVTELRQRLGIDEWPAAEGDPLLTLAHVLAGFASLLFLYAEWLVALAADLALRLGPDRWEGAPLAPVVA
jgi:hypothetical protein